MKKKIDIQNLTTELIRGKVNALSKAITIIESSNPEDKQITSEILNEISKYPNSSLRIAITGAPGAGKSTFIENFGLTICDEGNKLAVLSIDPSSDVSKGSILGDKTRMENLSKHSNCFIRPSPSSGYLGGVTPSTRNVIKLCEAAGYNYIFIETVGVGQSEYLVRNISDLFILLIPPGAGDDLQGIKKGILELTDLILINKSDGENLTLANQTKAYYESSISLMKPYFDNWKVDLINISALEQQGFDKIIEKICEFKEFSIKNDLITNLRKNQDLKYFDELLSESLLTKIYSQKINQELINTAKSKILDSNYGIEGKVGELVSEILNQGLTNKN